MMIQLDNISKFYYSANAVAPALRRIKLEFEIGEFVAITGESGSGKTTLLNIISGLDTYDDGELYIGGEATSHFDAADWQDYRKNKVGFVFQDYSLIENYSALHNVESALLIQGYQYTDANEIAKKLLIKVGLEDQSERPTNKLSSGQKQRLSIARALAKDTDIIVADEPTGNLDSENGRQIMELFRELSEDKLILVVTHNFEEAAPYATRKIRLHDGEVVSDHQYNAGNIQKSIKNIEAYAENTQSSSKKTEAIEGNLQSISKNSKGKIRNNLNSDRRIAGRFALLNMVTQPRRVLLFLVFLLFTASITFLFLGEIYSNWDDIFTKKYDDDAFLNCDPTRIIVKKPDGSEITQDDVSRLKQVKYVKTVDMYGFSNDINYYIEPEKDYDYVYKPKDNLKATEKPAAVKFLDESKFMRSTACITESDLSSGRLPESRNEIVLSSKEDSVLGKEQICYFTSKNTWGYSQYYSAKVTVVGVLKSKSGQVYFSEELCNMLSLDLYGDSYKIQLNWNMFKWAYDASVSFVPVIGENLPPSFEDGSKTIHSVRVSEDLVLPNGSVVAGIALIDVFLNSKTKDAVSDITLNANVDSNYNVHSPCFIELDEKLFYQIFQHKSKQLSLYIKDYIYMDKVLKSLANMGYSSISSYRISAVEYDDDLVAERNVIIIKALLVLLVVSILEIIIIRSIFQLRYKAYYILSSMGMNYNTIKYMNYYEMLAYTTAAILIVPVAAKLISLYPVLYLKNIVKYYDILHLLIYLALNLVVIIITVGSFNRYLKRKQKRSQNDTGK